MRSTDAIKKEIVDQYDYLYHSDKGNKETEGFINALKWVLEWEI